METVVLIPTRHRTTLERLVVLYLILVLVLCTVILERARSIVVVVFVNVSLNTDHDAGNANDNGNEVNKAARLRESFRNFANLPVLNPA